MFILNPCIPLLDLYQGGDVTLRDQEQSRKVYKMGWPGPIPLPPR